MTQGNIEEQAVRQLLIDFGIAAQRQDGAAIDQMWAEEFRSVTPAGVVLNKAQRLAAMTASNTRFDFLSRDEDELRLYGNVALEIARITVKGQILGQAGDQQYRVSTALVKRAGRWQIVSQHFTSIPKG